MTNVRLNFLSDRITYPDGSTGRFDFRADENGFYVESPRLPVGPEIPAHALEQIRKGEEERAAVSIIDLTQKNV